MEDLDTLVVRTAHRWWTAQLQPVLVTVARTWGSSPRPPGSLMAISGTGQTAGSVSGGCIEDDLVREILAGGPQAVCPDGVPVVRRYGISSEQAHRAGLPCGGTLELVMEPVSALSGLPALLDALARRQVGARLLHLASGRARWQPGAPAGAPRFEGGTLVTGFGPQARLVLIGAGDLSAYASSIAIGLGFEVIVCDPRPEQAPGAPVPGVTFSREMPDDLVQRLGPDARTAVVALTHDPKLDDLALIDALQTPAFYVGAIGSRRNSDLRRARLREHFGLTDEALQRLRGPAGLYIGSRTPPQIALSIMAEVVAALNGVVLPPEARVAEGKACEAHARA